MGFKVTLFPVDRRIAENAGLIHYGSDEWAWSTDPSCPRLTNSFVLGGLACNNGQIRPQFPLTVEVTQERRTRHVDRRVGAGRRAIGTHHRGRREDPGGNRRDTHYDRRRGTQGRRGIDQ